MGYKLSDIIKKIEEYYPRSLALSFDNPGLLVGRADTDVESVLLALDADLLNINKALELGADAVISHHPIIFNPIKSISDEDQLGLKLLSLIEHKIPVYSMHTNFDIGIGGMGDQAAKCLGIKDYVPLEVTGEQEGKEVGIGFVGELPAGPKSARELSALTKKAFSLDKLIVYDAMRPITKIACCPGSGHGMMEQVILSGADAFISGDISHHEGLDYKDAGVSLIDAGHFGIEHIFTPAMESFLLKHFPGILIHRGDTDERIFI